MIKTIYLEIDKGKLVEAPTLYDAIVNNPDVKTVILFWQWTKDYFTSNAGPFVGYVSQTEIDEDYSFQGDRDSALAFAQEYDCWDGQDFVILNDDILYGFCDNTDMQTSWNDGYDHRSGVRMGIDPSWISFIRADFDYKNGIEYLLMPGPITVDKNKGVDE